MKRQSIIFLVTIVAVITMASCKKNEAKQVNLTNQNDSLNYALGIANGDGLKNYYMNDVKNENEAVNVFISALDKAYNAKEETDEMYQLGTQIGGSFKQQQKEGLFGEKDMKFNEKLVKEGLKNAMSGDADAGMTAAEAQEYIQSTMQQIQQEKANALKQSAPADEDIVIEEEIIEEAE